MPPGGHCFGCGTRYSSAPHLAHKPALFHVRSLNECPRFAGGETEVALCQPCAGANQCGVLDDEFVVPVDSLGGLSFGTVFPKKSSLFCRSDVCVPSHVADPSSLCRVVSDEALLYRTRRLLQASSTPSLLTNQPVSQCGMCWRLRLWGHAGWG